MPNLYSRGTSSRLFIEGIPVTQIILRCADTRPDWMAGRAVVEKVAEIRRWHVQQRGWRDIGYHWIIDPDGSVASGRRETEIGAHVEGHNRGTIGDCLLGGFGASAADPFETNFTAAQASAVKRLIGEIKGRTAIRKVLGQNDYAAKACSGFGVPKQAPRLPTVAPLSPVSPSKSAKATSV